MNEERKAKLKVLIKQVAEMTDEQKDVLVKKMGIMNPEAHVLSPRNQILLYLQNPKINFSIVGGFKQWLRSKRCVNKGQKGFIIAVPSSSKKDNDEENPDIYFLYKTVFDISQTKEI